MPSTARLLPAALAAATLAVVPAGAHAATVARLTVTAAAPDGSHLVRAQALPDGTSVLALPRDGIARTPTLDASGSQGATGWAFDADTRSTSDDCGCASVSRTPYKAVTLALDTPRTSSVVAYGDFQQQATAGLSWSVVLQPEARVTAPATAPATAPVTFDASASQAFNADGTTRPVDHWQWDLDGAPGFERRTDDPHLTVPGGSSGARCAQVIAIDRSGAASAPVGACTQNAALDQRPADQPPVVVTPHPDPPTSVTATRQPSPLLSRALSLEVRRFGTRGAILAVSCPLGAVGPCRAKVRVTLSTGLRASRFLTLAPGHTKRNVRLVFPSSAAPSSRIAFEASGKDDTGPLVADDVQVRAPLAAPR